MEKRLYRSKTDRKLSGVCGGIAQYLAVDPTIIRLLAVLAAFFVNLIIVFIYIACIFIIPEEPGYIDGEYKEKEL